LQLTRLRASRLDQRKQAEDSYESGTEVPIKAAEAAPILVAIIVAENCSLSCASFTGPQCSQSLLRAFIAITAAVFSYQRKMRVKLLDAFSLLGALDATELLTPKLFAPPDTLRYPELLSHKTVRGGAETTRLRFSSHVYIWY
jgi:hypothetical protein